MNRLLITSVSVVLLFPALTFAATLSFGGNSTYTVGDIVSVPVFVSTDSGEVANAASASVSYPGQLLTLESILKTGSIMTVWPQDPSFSQSGGSAQFEGVVLNPGWSGQNGTVVTLIFQAKTSGNVVLMFSNGSVLANDGKGTEILSGSPSRAITIEPKATTPSPLPSSVPAPRPISPKIQIESSPMMPISTTTATATPPIPFATTSAFVERDQYTLWILGVLLALALLGAALWYLKNVLHALKREKRGNKLGRTHLVIHKQFSELKEAVASEILALEHAKTRRELSEEEEKFVERLKVMLSSAEKTIENELDSVT